MSGSREVTGETAVYRLAEEGSKRWATCQTVDSKGFIWKMGKSFQAFREGGEGSGDCRHP
jgi:hypothetical protein